MRRLADIDIPDQQCLILDNHNSEKKQLSVILLSKFNCLFSILASSLSPCQYPPRMPLVFFCFSSMVTTVALKRSYSSRVVLLGRTGRPIGVSSCFRVFLRLLKSWQWRQTIIYNRSAAGVTANRRNWPLVVEGFNCFERKSPLYLVHHWDEVQCLPTFRENLQHGLLKTFSVGRKLHNQWLWDYFVKLYRRLRKHHQLWFVWNKLQPLF